MQAPSFWYQPQPTWQAHLLAPLAQLYGTFSRLHQALRAQHVLKVNVPVIGIGNLTVGGGGKTPLTALLAHHFATRYKVAIIVGQAAAHDEALLLAHTCPQALVISQTCKKAAIRQAVTQGATLILLDDAFHRRDIHQDISLLTFGPQGLGNRHILPAGPLREPPAAAARATLYVCQDTPLPTELPPKPTFTLTRTLEAATLQGLQGKPLVAFAALAHPQTFFTQLQTHGLALAATLPLPDHHTYPASTLTTLQALAKHHNAMLVCTMKDSVKLPATLPHIAIPLHLEGDTSALLKALDTQLATHANLA